MAITPRLDLKQSQSLVMTPQLQQAIKLLQYNNAELSDYIEGELQQNPLLDRDDGDGSATAEAVAADNLLAHGDPYEEAAAPEPEGWESESDFNATDTVDQTTASSMPADGADPNDVDYDNNWASASANGGDDGYSGSGEGGQSNWQANSGRGGFDDDEYSLENRLSADKTLREHLMEQLTLDISEPADRMIGHYLIEMVEDSGYLTGDFSLITDALGCEMADVERVLERVQGFDPAGVFCRDLAECLALQLKDQNRYDPAIAALLENLEMLAKRELPALLKICGVDAEDLNDMIADIRSLNPKPGEPFAPNLDGPVAPDVIMRARPDGGWSIDLNMDNLPRVLVNNSYHSEISKQTKSKDDKSYVNECFQSANWLVKSLHQRATTILKVSTEIVRQQEAFFYHGVQHLRPLVLRDIADAIEMHESTVSRVTSNKYMETPRGLFELKYFFTSAIASSGGGEALSAESIRHQIKELIDAESPKKILSDDKLVTILQDKGIDIARRTVAKYREAMKIPSSVQRRREKNLGL